MTERENKSAQLAKEVLLLSRNTLLVNLRFLDAALSRLELVAEPRTTLMTDARHIFYGPHHVLESYQKASQNPVRDYLHMVMHCVFRHMYMSPMLDRLCWDLACDIAVENVITELGIRAAAAPREQQQTRYVRDLAQKLRPMTAEKIYSYLRDAHMEPAQLAKVQTLFHGDDHSIWYASASDGPRSAGAGTGAGDDSTENNGNGSAERDGDGENTSQSAAAAAEQDWKDIARRMQVDRETFGKQRGTQAGAMIQNLAAVNREKHDYTAFLKKFAVMGERMMVNDDEFDYIFYTYGLQLYKNMPLIEPLEYKEDKSIREFVVAIDTSGSTAGALAQKFVQKTYNILKSTESFFTKVNVHIIQCDTQIQEDAKITSQEEFDEYLKSMKIRGQDGTDFRPVFEYVDKLQRECEFMNLKGLIYFTDGYGTFPSRKPDYETAFVFIDSVRNSTNVPPWAIRLVLAEDEI